MALRRPTRKAAQRQREVLLATGILKTRQKQQVRPALPAQRTVAETVSTPEAQTASPPPPSPEHPSTCHQPADGPVVATFNQAITEAAEARQQQEKATRFALLQADEFIQALETSEAVNSPDTAYATFLIRQHAIDIAHALAQGRLKAPKAFLVDGKLPAAYPPGPIMTRTKHPEPAGLAPAAATWAQVTAAANTASHTPSRQTRKPETRLRPRGTPTTASLDNRLFIRLDKEHSLRSVHPHIIMQRIQPALAGAQLESIQAIPTGLALKPMTRKDAEALLNKAGDIQTVCNAVAVEPADPWIKLRIPRVPRMLHSLLGHHEVSLEEVQAELVQAFGCTPTRICWGNIQERDPSNSRPLLVDFRKRDLQKVPANVQLFCTKLPVLVRKKNPRVMQCTRCWAYHRPEHCTRAPRCSFCASIEHSCEQHIQQITSSPTCGASPGQCQCPNRCSNCYGPHPATDETCPLRPGAEGTRKHRSEVEAIRKAGRARWQAANSCPMSAGRLHSPSRQNSTEHESVTTPTDEQTSRGN